MSDQTFRDTPYKGLVPYSEEDAPFFFGREAEREIITANLMASRLTLLYGASGVGKSSVLRAGVAHNLQQLARKNLSEHGAPEFGVLVFNSWRDNPVEVLALRLHEALSSLVPAGNNVPEDGLRELPEILKAWSEAIDGDLFIILDQFEEYFLYHAQEDGDNSFAVQFPRAVNRSDLRVSFLISIREDALARLDRFKGRIPNLFDNYLRIDHLDRNAARSAITEPAHTYNSLHPSSSISIEPPLVEAVLDQVKTNEVVLGSGGRGVVETRSDQSPTDERIETSYLQLVMTRLWQEEAGAGSRTLRLTTLDTLGGAKRIVQTHVDAVMERLEPDEQRAAAQLFYFLVTRDGTKIAHTVSALSEYTRTDETQLTGVLEKLCGRDARILQPVDPPPGQPDSPRYEIRHDKLAAAILDWRRRYAQAEEKAEVERLAIKQRQEAEAQARVEEKAKSAARLRWLSIALAVMTLLASVMAAYAFKQQRRALRDAHNATAQATEAEKQRHLAEEERAQADEQREFAHKQERVAIEERERANEAAKLARAREAEANIAKAEAEAARGVAEMATNRISVIARSRELATASMSNLSSDPELSVLLALQAVSEFNKEPGINETEKKEAIEALHEATLVSRVRHTFDGNVGNESPDLPDEPKRIDNVAYGMNGGRLITQSTIGRVSVWDTASGKWLGNLSAGVESHKRLVLSHDGTHLAITLTDGKVQVCDLANLKCEHTLYNDHESKAILSMAFSRDDSILAVMQDEDIMVWNWTTNEKFTLPHGQKFAEPWGFDTFKSFNRELMLTFHKDGKTLIATGCVKSDRAGCQTFGVKAWDVSTRQESRPPATKNLGSFKRPSFIFSDDGERVFTVFSDDKKAILWDAGSGKEFLDFSERRPIFPAAFSSDAKQLATLSNGNAIIVWDITGATPNVIEQIKIEGSVESLKQLAFSPNGERIVAFGGKTVEAWSVKSGKKLLTLSGHKDSVVSIAFAPAGQFIATASDDGTAKMWDTTLLKELLTLTTPDEFPARVWFSPDGKRLTGVFPKTVKEWDAITGAELGSIFEADRSITSFAYSPERKLLALLIDGGVNIWDTTSRNNIWPKPNSASSECEIVFSPDGKLLAGGREKEAVMWNVQTGNEQSLVGHTDTVRSVALSPDGHILATGSDDKTAKLWDARRGRELRTITGHTAGVSQVRFSPDGRRLLTTSEHNVKIWEVSTGRELMILSGHSEGVNDVTFSNDGSLIATGSADGTAKVWLANTGEELFSLNSHSFNVSTVAFSPDNSRLVVTNSSGDALVYTLDVAELINLAQQRISRQLTVDERKRYLREFKK